MSQPQQPHSLSKPHPSAVILPPTESSLAACADRIKSGKLVAFPTETVYGLGANAFDRAAVLRIFAAKSRPLTDPLIVHVNGIDQALTLIDLDGHTLEVFQMLADTFWPGPLTLIGKARSHLPSELSAGTGYIGVRFPDFPVAIDLISESGVPIAAPSANKFGHVSPTSAAHVFADLCDEDVAILDGGRCRVGIESTVIKVDERCDGDVLVVYRKGGVSETQIKAALEAHGWSERTRFQYPSRHVKENGECGSRSSSSLDEPQKGEEAPGQMLTHYAPNINSWLLAPSAVEALVKRFSGGEAEGTVAGLKVFDADEERVDSIDKSTTVVIDFNGALSAVAGEFLAYKDLANNGDVAKAAEGLYQALRWSELVEDAETVLMVEIVESNVRAAKEHVPAVRDKMYRAASGKVAAVCK